MNRVAAQVVAHISLHLRRSCWWISDRGRTPRSMSPIPFRGCDSTGLPGGSRARNSSRNFYAMTPSESNWSHSWDLRARSVFRGPAVVISGNKIAKSRPTALSHVHVRNLSLYNWIWGPNLQRKTSKKVR